MSAATTASRADRLIEGAEAGSLAHAKHLNAGADVATDYQVSLLEQIVRGLCAELDRKTASVENLVATVAEQGQALTRQRNQIREQTEKLNELTFRLCDDEIEAESDELSQRIAAFNRSTGAAEALRGGL